MISFLSKRIKSIGYALKGAYILVSTEASIKVQFCIGILMTVLGFYYKLSIIEWIIQTLIIVTIIALEGINTAIEEIANFIHPEQNNKIGTIKDLAAGAVFIFAIGAVIVGCLIYLPKIF